MSRLVTNTEIDDVILSCFDGTEWHLSLWFPKIARGVLGLPALPSDGEFQAHLLELIERGALEAGAVDGAAFNARRLELRGAYCPDLYVRCVEG